MQNQLLFLTITDRDTELFSGEVKSITSYNDKGTFDVLPEHTNFISLIKDKVEIEMSDGKINTVPISDGVLKVEGNKIEIFLGVDF